VASSHRRRIPGLKNDTDDDDTTVVITSATAPSSITEEITATFLPNDDDDNNNPVTDEQQPPLPSSSSRIRENVTNAIRTVRICHTLLDAAASRTNAELRMIEDSQRAAKEWDEERERRRRSLLAVRAASLRQNVAASRIQREFYRGVIARVVRERVATEDVYPLWEGVGARRGVDDDSTTTTTRRRRDEVVAVTRIQRLFRGFSVRWYFYREGVTPWWWCGGGSGDGKSVDDDDDDDDAGTSRRDGDERERAVRSRVEKDFHNRRVYERKELIHRFEQLRRFLDECFDWQYTWLNERHRRVERRRCVLSRRREKQTEVTTERQSTEEMSPGERAVSLKITKRRKSTCEYLESLQNISLHNVKTHGRETARLYQKSTLLSQKTDAGLRTMEIATATVRRLLRFVQTRLNAFADGGHDGDDEGSVESYYRQWLTSQETKMISLLVKYDAEQELLLERETKRVSNEVVTAKRGFELVAELCRAVVAEDAYESERLGVELARLCLTAEKEKDEEALLRQAERMEGIQNKLTRLREQVIPGVSKELAELYKRLEKDIDSLPLDFVGDDHDLELKDMAAKIKAVSNSNNSVDASLSKINSTESEWMNLFYSQPWLATQMAQEAREQAFNERRQINLVFNKQEWARKEKLLRFDEQQALLTETMIEELDKRIDPSMPAFKRNEIEQIRTQLLSPLEQFKRGKDAREEALRLDKQNHIDEEQQLKERALKVKEIRSHKKEAIEQFNMRELKHEMEMRVFLQQENEWLEHEYKILFPAAALSRPGSAGFLRRNNNAGAGGTVPKKVDTRRNRGRKTSILGGILGKPADSTSQRRLSIFKAVKNNFTAGPQLQQPPIKQRPRSGGAQLSINKVRYEAYKKRRQSCDQKQAAFDQIAIKREKLFRQVQRQAEKEVEARQMKELQHHIRVRREYLKKKSLGEEVSKVGVNEASNEDEKTIVWATDITLPPQYLPPDSKGKNKSKKQTRNNNNHRKENLNNNQTFPQPLRKIKQLLPPISAQLPSLKRTTISPEEEQMMRTIRKRMILQERKIRAISRIVITVGQEETETFRKDSLRRQSQGDESYYRKVRGEIGTHDRIALWVSYTIKTGDFITDLKIASPIPGHKLFVNLRPKGYHMITHPRTKGDGVDPALALWYCKDSNDTNAIEDIDISFSTSDETKLLKEGYQRVSTSNHNKDQDNNNDFDLSHFGLGVNSHVYTKKIKKTSIPPLRDINRMSIELRDYTEMLQKSPHDAVLQQMVENMRTRLRVAQMEQEERASYQNPDVVASVTEFLALSPDELHRFERTYHDLDTDGDGYLSLSEFAAKVLAEPLSLSSAAADDDRRHRYTRHLFFVAGVTVTDDKLDFPSVLKAVTTFGMFTKNDVLPFLFGTMDRKGYGVVSHDDFYAMLTTLHPYDRGRVKRALREFDLIGNGRGTTSLSYREFAELHGRFPHLFYPAFGMWENLRTVFMGGSSWWEGKLRRFNSAKERVRKEREERERRGRTESAAMELRGLVVSSEGRGEEEEGERGRGRGLERRFLKGWGGSQLWAARTN